MIDQKVRELLTKHDYRVIVKEEEPDYISLRLPKNDKFSESFFNYTVIDHTDLEITGDPGFFIGDVTCEDPSFVVCPFYSVRPVIQCHIEKLCKKINYSPRFIFYYNHKNEEVGRLPLSPPREEEDFNKETVLNNIFVQAKSENFPPDFLRLAAKEKVEVGYGMLYNLEIVAGE